MPKIHFVLAGNYREFRHFLIDNDVPERSDTDWYVYVYGPESVMGYREVEDVLRYGTWWRRRDYHEHPEYMNTLIASRLGKRNA